MSQLAALLDGEGAFVTFRQAFGVENDEPWRLRFFAYLVHAGGETIAVDTGAGPPGADPFLPDREGRLPAELDRVGVAREDVGLVLLTHLHPDHVGWNMVDGSPFFPNARYLAHRDDFEWIVGSRPDRPYVRENVVALEASGRLELVGDSVEPVPGVRLQRIGGHTPGHCIVDLGDATLAGDLAVHELQLADPTLAYVAEEDPATIAGARAELLPGFADAGRLLGFGHLGLGRVERAGTGFAWRPLD
jgi:glyoxylase-like metal-dependent hydrolase (beta-lactamase superfamily II)